MTALSPQSTARLQPYEPLPLEVLLGDSPAAGSGFSITNPGRLGWLLVAVRFQLVTSAVVGNRNVTVDYEDGNGTIYMRHPFSAAQAAGATQLYNLSERYGAPFAGSSGALFGGLNPMPFDVGRKLQVNVAGMDAGDQLSSIVLAFLRPPTAPS